MRDNSKTWLFPHTCATRTKIKAGSSRALMHVKVSAHSKAPEYRLDERARPDAKSMIDFGRKDTHSDANTPRFTSYTDPHRNQSHTCIGRREKRANTTSSSGARRDSLARWADKLEEEERARDDEDPI